MKYKVTFLIKQNMSIKDTFEYLEEIINDCGCRQSKKIPKRIKENVVKKLPIYYRAMAKVKMEIENYIVL